MKPSHHLTVTPWRIIAFFVAYGFLALVVLGLAGCEDRKCLRSHLTTSVVPIFTGKMLVPILITHSVCDEWEERDETTQTP